MRTPTFFLFAMLILTDYFAAAQSASFLDPAVAYNRILIEKGNEQAFYKLKNYRVMGSPFLLGESNRGTIFSGKLTVNDITLGYNMYDESISFLNGSTKLVKECEEVDSFFIRKNIQAGIEQDLFFVNSRHLGNSKKCKFFLLLYKGSRYSLYKSYTAELGSANGVMVGSDIRQFDVQAEYNYVDSLKKTPVKLKVKPNNLLNEFRAHPGVKTALESGDLDQHRESTLKEIFIALNDD